MVHHNALIARAQGIQRTPERTLVIARVDQGAYLRFGHLSCWMFWPSELLDAKTPPLQAASILSVIVELLVHRRAACPGRDRDRSLQLEGDNRFRTQDDLLALGGR